VQHPRHHCGLSMASQTFCREPRPHEFHVFVRSKAPKPEVENEPPVRCIPILLKAPVANVFCESYIGKPKQEVLNHFICFSRGQLDYIRRVWLKHYHEQRPHRGGGRDNTVLDVDFVPQTEGHIRRKSEIGGILKRYYREAA
jgi:hypothetical protein